MIRQATVTECGLACVAMIAGYFGNAEDLTSLRRRFGASLKGATLSSLIRNCESIRLSARAVRCRLSEVASLKMPCVLHWEFDHFVVLRKATGRHLFLHDPARGAVRVSFAEADNKFTGVALELTPLKDFQQKEAVRRLRLSDLVVFDRGFASSASVALVVAVLSELLLLAMPFYLQAVIDQVLMRGDHLLLNTLVLGFALLAVFQLVASGIRQLTFQFLSQATVFSLSSRVLRHLLHLPIGWFRERRLGDIQQRMQSLAGLQMFVTQSAPALVLDTIFLSIVVILMIGFAPMLTLIVILTTLVYAAWRVLLFPTMLEQAGRLVRAEAAVQTHLLESLRAMHSIKTSAGEGSRTLDWLNLLVRRINTQIEAGNLSIVDSTVHRAVSQGLHIGVIFLLARAVQGGELSIGAVSAFVAYSGMFATRAGGIINRVFEYCLLKIPLDRLADIIFNRAESYEQRRDTRAVLAGNLRVSDLTFAYSQSDEAILKNVTMDIGRGEFIAIRGSSGCGKSTLLRLLAGVEQPPKGKVYYDGKPADDWPLLAMRRGIATVFHDDALIAGSIAENIALFDRDIDTRRVRLAAEQAAIAATIDTLPMGYATPIGDLGSVLSTGQVQRILLARALYRRPSILLLDEFTSGLDEDTERRVLNSLTRLPATRIAVTHSAIVLRAADRVFKLSDGRLAPL